MRKNFFLILLLLSGSINLLFSQQFEFVDSQELRIIENDQLLRDPFSGGFNAVQLKETDIDQDGETEWVIYDRSNNKAYIGIMTDGIVKIDHNRSDLLPREIDNWLILADFDGDGRPDIFTDTSFGVKVIRNGVDSWEVLDGNLKANSNGNLVNIVVSGSDYPAIGDFDKDGDVDLLVFDFVAGDRIVLYKNISVENNLDDPLVFEKNDLFWGGIEECNCNDFVFDDSGCDPNRPQKTEHAASKAITFFGDDLFIGIEGCPQVAFLPNRENFEKAEFNSFNTEFFPKNDFGEYTVTTFGDVDNDGTNDFIVANNTRTDGYFLDYSRSINVFSGADKSIITDQFLQNNTIDVGEQSYPSLHDWDGDGDLDLFIGNKGKILDDRYVGTISYYENTGNFRNPEFTLRETDFLNLSNQELVKLNPTFIDVNEDGLTDLLLSAGKRDFLQADMLLMLRNEDLSFSDPIDWGFRFSRNDLPMIRDVNADGRLDIILGRNFGRLNLYLNLGTNLAPEFEEQDDFFLGIDSDGQRLNPTLAFVNVDDDAAMEILKSDSRGLIEVYQPESSDPTSENYLNPLTDEPTRFDLGINNPMAFGDLYGNNALYGFIGDIRGGLKVIQLTSTDPVEILEEIIGYPNPLVDVREIRFYSDRSQPVSVFDASGRKVMSSFMLEAGEELTLDVSELTPGMYFFRGVNNTFRVVVQ
ncbi:MAG: T9SS type A sorting domain-containing protein [Bacteroidota bacterium]